MVTHTAYVHMHQFTCEWYVCRWENLDKNVAMPDDDLSESPPYMELSDDDEGDDSNCCPPLGGGLSTIAGRSLSNPFPDGRVEMEGSHSSDSGVEPRLKSPSDGNIVVGSAGLLGERSRGGGRENGRAEKDDTHPGTDTVVNGGTLYTMYSVCVCTPML